MKNFAAFVQHLSALLLCLTVFQCGCQDPSSSRTFSGNRSFVQYPRWNADPQRLLRFTFQTSELNAVLLYTRGSSDFLLIRLVDGSLLFQLSLRPDEVEDHSLGVFLNDNLPHTVTVYHDPSISQFEYQLDSGSPLELSYASNLVPRFGPNGVFFGGVPASSSLANDTFFVGCLENVLFSSANISRSDVSSSTLQSVGPLQVGGDVRDGCEDPCSAVSCGPGVCVARWPNRAFCDCRGTGFLGPECDEG